jgi:glycine betaine/proline transport system permease protein
MGVIAMALIGTAVLAVFFLPFDHALNRFPEAWQLEVVKPFGNFIKYLAREFAIGPIQFSSVTRGIGRLVSQPFLFLNGVLATGFTFFHEDSTRTVIPALPWTAVASLFVLTAWRFTGMRFTLFTIASFLFFALFGLWESAMLTFSSIIIAMIISTAGGILLGLWGYRSDTVDVLLRPIYDVMQVLPIFSYLVPMILFFGFGPIAALMATVIFAMPPMARVTTQALREVHNSIIEFGTIVGCNKPQMTLLVLIPAARKSLFLGVNQVIMLSLAVVIVASLIGAGGLGGDVLKALKSVRLGQAITAGLAISLMAIVLDRLSFAIAMCRPDHKAHQQTWYQRYQFWIIAVAIILLSCILSKVFPALHTWPEDWAIPVGDYANNFVDWISKTYYSDISVFRDVCIIYVMKPVKLFFLSLPWLSVILFVAGVGAILGGWRLALLGIVVFGLIAMLGYWEKAMISLYLVSLSVFITMIIGFALGLGGAVSNRAHVILTAFVDLLQTLPTFVYLIPVVMILSVGDVPALVAIILYALAPAIRYTDVGIRNVQANFLDAAVLSGCNTYQLMTLVKIPLALPTILLGLNQTLMMAWGMLVITALVGTRGLEEITLISIAYVAPGDGLLAGLAIAGMAIVFDRYIRAASDKLANQLGVPVPK